MILSKSCVCRCSYGLLDECRVLLLHGVLHLLGYDHELGPEEAAEMAAAEQQIMKKLGWKVRCPHKFGTAPSLMARQVLCSQKRCRYWKFVLGHHLKKIR